MYQRILVPVDGSATAERGLAEAMQLCKLTGGRLRLIHVVDELSFALSASEGMAFSGDVVDVLRESGTAILGAAADRVRASGLATFLRALCFRLGEDADGLSWHS